MPQRDDQRRCCRLRLRAPVIVNPSKDTPLSTLTGQNETGEVRLAPHPFTNTPWPPWPPWSGPMTAAEGLGGWCIRLLHPYVNHDRLAIQQAPDGESTVAAVPR